MIKTNEANTEIVKFPYYRQDLRADNPRASFPKNMSAQQLAEFGVRNEVIAGKPIFDAETQIISQKELPEKVGNDWVIGWNVSDMASEGRRVRRKQRQKTKKLRGVSLGGIMASATRHDQDGLTAISVGVIMARSAGSTFPDTLFEFVNGSELLITNDNFDGYFATWSAFRQGFFAP